MSLFVSLKNFVINVLNIMLSFLPNSPFQSFFNVLEQNVYLNNLNWFISFSDMIAIGQAWLVSIAVFYAYQAVLRWVKAIE